MTSDVIEKECCCDWCKLRNVTLFVTVATTYDLVGRDELRRQLTVVSVSAT